MITSDASWSVAGLRMLLFKYSR